MLISHNLRRNAEGTRITFVYKVQFLCGPPWIQEHDRYYSHIVNTIKSTTPRCMINIFMGGERVVDGEGASSERCLKWDGGGSLIPKTS